MLFPGAGHPAPGNCDLNTKKQTTVVENIVRVCVCVCGNTKPAAL